MNERLGAYWLLERIGAGGMAEVYLALPSDEPEGEYVVVKRALPELLDREDILEMFRDEVRISSLLHHRNIVRVLDFDEERSVPYIVLEYVDGLPLSRLMQRMKREPFPIPLACWIISEACAGLSYAHRRTLTYSSQPLGIVHRDFSPQNILLSVDGAVKLTDFGVAKAEMRLTRTSPGEVKGKYGYMSPEQCRSDGHMDHRSDIFSAGAVLYEMTTGSPLFGSSSPPDVLWGLMHGSYTPPEERVSGYPDALASIVNRALKWEPEERYADAREMRQDLMLLLADEEIPASELAALVRRYQKKGRKQEQTQVTIRDEPDTEID